jgi:hypothetical protein
MEDGHRPVVGDSMDDRGPNEGFSAATAQLGRVLGFDALERASGVSAGHIARCAKRDGDRCLTAAAMVALDAEAARDGLGTPFLAAYVTQLSERLQDRADALLDRLAKDLDRARARRRRLEREAGSADIEFHRPR